MEIEIIAQWAKIRKKVQFRELTLPALFASRVKISFFLSFRTVRPQRDLRAE